MSKASAQIRDRMKRDDKFAGSTLSQHHKSHRPHTFKDSYDKAVEEHGQSMLRPRIGTFKPERQEEINRLAENLPRAIMAGEYSCQTFYPADCSANFPNCQSCSRKSAKYPVSENIHALEQITGQRSDVSRSVRESIVSSAADRIRRTVEAMALKWSFLKQLRLKQMGK